MSYDYLKDSIPNDHSRQVRATDLVISFKNDKKLNPKDILDLGCGVGDTISYFKKIFPSAQWTGVDIEDSPEVNARKQDGAHFVTYNGENLPFIDGRFDLIFSNQVLEHVRYPEKVLAEVHRTLSSDGVFIGQTSNLEPYHSFSLWNFTPYGFKRICETAGLKLIEIRPSLDGITLIERSYHGRPTEYSKWFSQESPLNQEIEKNALEQKRRPLIRNFRKLIFCGQFAFACKKMGQ